MPKKVIDYSKTIIYKIVCSELDISDCYIGHTTDFRRRKNQHKSKLQKGSNFKVYQMIRQQGGWGKLVND